MPKKKKRAGRPPGSKKKTKTGKRRGRKPSISNNPFGGFESQIKNLQHERKSMMQNIKSIDKAISILKKLS